VALEDAFEERFRQAMAGLLRVGTVTGTAVGGRVLVTVQGTSMTLPRLTAYTPVVGHNVLILCLMPGAWFVLGTPATT